MLTSALAALATILSSGAASEPAPANIAWYADWDTARAEAERSQRPIILQFVRPACQGVSGVF